MLNKEDLKKWLEVYDDIKYPNAIYQELVVEGRAHPKKFALMGAWKTGSLRISAMGNEYKDLKGQRYIYTDRWKKSAPVGFEVWNYVSDNQSSIKDKIPKDFPLEKPQIAVDIQSNKGFGFIWMCFVLHCFYPKIYPLYNQHVYRAYKNLCDKDIGYMKTASDSWSEYLNYKNFFNKALADVELKYWELDRALWAYGKYLKQDAKINKKDLIQENDLNMRTTGHSSDNNSEWVHSLTLGGKSKSFWWKIDGVGDLHIKRKFNNAAQEIVKVIKNEELKKIDDYSKGKGWIDLSNNVEKLYNGSEKDGLGKFLYETRGWTVADAQLASHLGVVFSLAGCWEYNGMKRGIKFRKNDLVGIERIKEAYLKELAEDF